MTAVAAPVYPHISEEPQVMAGRPCITGTRVRVMDVVAATRTGIAPEELREYFSSRALTLSEIHAVLTYFYDHQEQIEAALAEDAKLSQEVERELAAAGH